MHISSFLACAWISQIKISDAKSIDFEIVLMIVSTLNVTLEKFPLPKR